MKKTLLSGVCLASIALGANSAQAQSLGDLDYSPNFYVSIFGGVAIPEDVDGTATNATGTGFSVSLDADTGFAVGGAIGTRVNEWLRAELEVSYDEVDADNFSGSNATFAFSYSARGSVDALYILANVWFDVPLDMPVQPYLGGGLGVGIVDANVKVGPGGTFGPNESDTGFAFQVGAGLRYAVTENINLDVGYRFKGVENLDFDDRIGALAGNRNFDLYTHVVRGGITIDLGGM